MLYFVKKKHLDILFFVEQSVGETHSLFIHIFSTTYIGTV